MQVVWQLLVDTLASIGRHVGSDDQVNIRQQEEDGHWEGCTDPRVPVGILGAPVQVDIDQAARDKDVDDRERVRDQARRLIR